MAQHRQRYAPGIEINGGPSTHRIACDRCLKTINFGELRYACLECYGWVPPESQTKNIRMVEMQRTQTVHGRGFTVEAHHTQSATGYDLCKDCAHTGVHQETGHHFALWVTR